MNAFIQQACIKLIKSASEDISNVTKVNAVLLNFILICESWKKKNMHHVFHKNIVQHNCVQHW